MDIIYAAPIWVLVVGMLALMFGANEIGYYVGRNGQRDESDRAYAVSNGLKASILGLIALLLGFSYSMTSSRFNFRQRMVLDEANAIGTCYLRSGLLTEPERSQLRSTLENYMDLRLEYFERAFEPGVYDRTTTGMDAALADLWSAVETVVAQKPEQARVSQIVPAANAVIDLSATRAWASHNQMPPSVILVLATCMTVSGGIMGHSSGQAGRRHQGLWTALNVLVMLVLFVILDFDRPRRGFVQIDHSPLIELRKSMRP